MHREIIEKTLLFVSALIIVLLLHGGLSAETVFLKDGSVITGSIVSDTASTIVFYTKDGKTINVNRTDIIRILYTKLKMGKVYVQMRDGKGFTAFIVDEDQDSYTCRSELYSPKEFIIKRSDVLFIAEKNPSGLQVEGEIGTDRVPLKWLPPYGMVKKYNLYKKEGEKSKYQFAGSSSGKKITLGGLKSNTIYYIIVKSVDTEGYESSPSNELIIKTGNIHPDRPVIERIKENKTGEVIVKWESCEDPDGKVVKYRIYSRKNGKPELVAELKTNKEYIITNPKNYISLDLVSVDNNGDESDSVEIPLYGENISLGFYPGIIYPMGKLGKVIGPGYGGSLSLMLNNYFHYRLILGVEAGYYTLTGKNALESEFKKTENSILVPLMFTAGYRFTGGKRTFLTPYLGAGVLYFQSQYIDKDRITYIERDKNISETGPGLFTGISGSFRISTAFECVIRLSAGYFAGTDSGFYTLLNAGCIYRF